MNDIGLRWMMVPGRSLVFGTMTFCSGISAGLTAAELPPSGVDFDVTVVTKTAAHPQFGTGHTEGFAVNGVEGMELFLIRGATYVFTISGDHPFAFGPDMVGADPATSYPATNGITGTPTGNGTVTFTPNASYPDLMFYVCTEHANMGWTINLSDPLVVVSPKVFLEGPYQGGQMMNDDLRATALLPIMEPYSALGYPGVSGGVHPAVLAVPGSDAIVDWMVVELRSSTAASVILARKVALLQRDGDVVGLDGSSPVQFSQPTGAYYVAIRHRNHLGVMTADAIALSPMASTVDFSSGATYGTNAQKDIGGTMVMWAGDVTFDGQIKYTGANNDRDPILLAIGGIVPTNVLSAEYRQEDVNMNTQVKYTGSLNDRDIMLVNVGGTVPTNVRIAQLP